MLNKIKKLIRWLTDDIKDDIRFLRKVQEKGYHPKKEKLIQMFSIFTSYSTYLILLVMIAFLITGWWLASLHYEGTCLNYVYDNCETLSKACTKRMLNISQEFNFTLPKIPKFST